ncbi:MAG: hydrogenase maturation nickel metallochaperone HypA [Candidatus Sumerlaeia bacterium]|nr:hydrogenase maturation nickel metallochaperone HypA [Candidatus Sumerlaeia bacterium]
MHEYTIAEALVGQIERIAREHPGCMVRSAVVAIGGLRRIVPDILRFGFEGAAAGTAAAGTDLVVEHVPIRIHCHRCNAESELDEPIYLCPACGHGDVAALSGDELILKSVDIDNGRNSCSAEHP